MACRWQGLPALVDAHAFAWSLLLTWARSSRCAEFVLQLLLLCTLLHVVRMYVVHAVACLSLSDSSCQVCIRDTLYVRFLHPAHPPALRSCWLHLLTCPPSHPPTLPFLCLQAGIASGNLASAAVGATNVAGTLIATSLIEGAGRKQLLTTSYLGMAATMALMAAGFGLPAFAAYRLVHSSMGVLSGGRQMRCTWYCLVEPLLASCRGSG